MKTWMISSFTAAALACLPVAAQAQDAYPAPGETVRILVGFGTGGGTDIATRLMAEALNERFDANFIVENVVGGGGLLAVNRLVDAKPDGYTLAIVPLPATNMLYLDPERGGDFTLEDLVPIAMHDYGPLAVAVGADSPWNDLTDLVEAAKENPGTLTAGSSGVLAAGHLGFLRLVDAADISVNWGVFDQAGMLLSTVMGGHIDFITDTFVELLPPYRNGDLKILAVMAEERQEGFPEIPTTVEQGYDVVVDSNRILVAPAGTPQNVVDTLEQAVAEITADPEYQKAAAQRQMLLSYRNSEDAKALWQEFDEVYTPLVETFRGLRQ